MRKYLILLLILIPIKTKAEIFLTDYYLKEQNIKEYKEETEYLKRIETIKYNNYYMDKVDLGYHKLKENDNNYDLNDYIEKTNYIINESNDHTTNIIKNYNKVRFIRFNSFNPSFLESFKMFYDNEEINYSYMRSIDFTLKDILSSSSLGVIDLNNIYDIELLTMNLTFKQNINDKISFDLGIYDGNNYAWNIEPEIYNFNINYSPNIEINFLNQSKYQELVNNLQKENNIDNISYTIIYEKLYRLYEPVKVYLNTYTEKPLENCIHDLNDYQKRYSYYERYYIEINNEIHDKEDLNLKTNIPLDEIDVTYKDDLITLKYKHDTFYKKITPKKVNKINNVVSKKDTTNSVIFEKNTTKRTTTKATKKTIISPTTNTKIITTIENKTKSVINQKSNYSILYLLILPILVIVYIFIRKNKI